MFGVMCASQVTDLIVSFGVDFFLFFAVIPGVLAVVESVSLHSLAWQDNRACSGSGQQEHTRRVSECAAEAEGRGMLNGYC